MHGCFKKFPRQGVKTNNDEALKGTVQEVQQMGCSEGHTLFRKQPMRFETPWENERSVYKKKAGVSEY